MLELMPQLPQVMSTNEIPVSLFNAIIQYQSNIATIAIGALVGLIAIFGLVSAIQNYVVSDRKISETLKEAKEELIANIDDKINKKYDEIRKNIEESTKSINVVMEKRLSGINAEACRLHARDAELQSSWELASIWWARAIGGYVDGDVQNLIGAAVRALRKCLEKSTYLSKKERDEIMENCQKIPDILSLEKEFICSRIESLPLSVPAS